MENNIAEIPWTPVAGTPDYQANGLVAIYKHTGPRGRGGNYHVFRDDLPVRKRTLANALSVGGLPRAILDEVLR